MILDEARSEGTLPLSQRVFEQYRALLASGVAKWTIAACC